MKQNFHASFGRLVASAIAGFLVNVGAASAAPNAFINLVNVGNGQCLDDLGYSLQPGALQGFWACNDAENQKLEATAVEDGKYVLINSYSKLCLDVPYASTSARTLIQQYHCNQTGAQKFKFISVGNGRYKIQTTTPSLCLDGSRGDGILQQETCNNSAHQTFTIRILSGSLGTGSVPTPTPTAAPQSVIPTGAGFNKGMSVGLFNYSASEIDGVVADLKSMGVTWVRVDFPWSEMQPNGPTHYNLEAWDRSVAAARKAGLNILGIIDYTPAWARPAGTNKFHPPSNVNDFATFASFLAKRYGPQGVHAWEIWNEQNGSTFWQPTPNPAYYVSLLKATYPALKAADPKSFVIIGRMATFADDGINQNARTFLANIYANGGKPYFDAVGFHPYTYPELPGSSIWNNWGQMSASTPSLRSIMIDNGDGHKQIWMTELGFPTMPSHPQLTEQRQTEYLKQAYEMQASYSWAGPLFWYTYQDNRVQQDPNYAEDWFGLLRADGSKKPAYFTYKNLPK